MFYNCRDEKDELTHCVEKWFYDDEFKEAVIEEYLNERSHFRQTGQLVLIIIIHNNVCSIFFVS